MTVSFEQYRTRRIVNVHKHVDGPWFWTKYSAHPYVGCSTGCAFCYARGSRYLGKRDPATFDSLIQVKTNAVELLRKELSRLEPEIISCGDWQQPAENRYHLSRAMLEVILQAGFPLLVVERSPLLTRDLDLLVEINQRSWVCVVLSISSLDPVLKRAFEPRSPGVGQRLQAMARLAEVGILAGTALMPVIPFVGDDQSHLQEVVRATADHGGSFVLVSGLTMEGEQARRTLEAARRLDADLERRFREFYAWSPGGRPRYEPPSSYSARLGRTVRDLCVRHGLRDRVPRYVAPGPLAINKRIAEQLFLKTYDLELAEASSHRIWAYRKAAWTVDDWPESLAELYGAGGETRLRDLPGVGGSLARQIAGWLEAVPG